MQRVGHLLARLSVYERPGEPLEGALAISRPGTAASPRGRGLESGLGADSRQRLAQLPALFDYRESAVSHDILEIAQGLVVLLLANGKAGASQASDARIGS